MKNLHHHISKKANTKFLFMESFGNTEVTDPVEKKNETPTIKEANISAATETGKKVIEKAKATKTGKEATKKNNELLGGFLNKEAVKKGQEKSDKELNKFMNGNEIIAEERESRVLLNKKGFLANRINSVLTNPNGSVTVTLNQPILHTEQIKKVLEETVSRNPELNRALRIPVKFIYNGETTYKVNI